MKNTFLSIVIFILGINMIYAQDSEDLGIMVGAIYYNGEINPQGLFKSPSPAVSIIYRHNFNERFTMRFQGDYSTLQASDALSKNEYQLARNFSFSSQIWDLGLQFELNLNKFNLKDYMVKYFTPYISTGAFLTYEPQSEMQVFMSIPFEVGFKYAINKKITAGVQWNYRLTNSDLVDNIPLDIYALENKQMSYNPDKDLISFAQVFITINLFKEEIFCPAY